MAEQTRHRRRSKLYLIFVLILIIATVLYLRPVPAIYPTNKLVYRAGYSTVTTLVRPTSVEAAIGAVGYGVLETSGQQTQKPTASTAKLITALAVLKRYPLSGGQSGPVITLGSNDVAGYKKYVALNGSVVPVHTDEKLSEYQMLQGMMLPSANNLADSLARWAFGSMANYKVAASDIIRSLGLSSTEVGDDASGFLPSYKSTSHDLVLVGQAVMRNPVLAQIVSQKTAVLPVVGKVKNVNWLLGDDGVIGIKTGNSDKAGGVYIFASNYLVAPKHNIIILGAVQDAPNLQAAMSYGAKLLNSAKQGFSLLTLARAGQTVGWYKVPWAGVVSALSPNKIVSLAWNNKPLSGLPPLHAIYAPAAAGAVVAGNDSGLRKIILKSPVNNPPWWWRILHS